MVRGKQITTNIYQRDELPMVSVVMSAFNEEYIIGQKVRSVAESDYDPAKLEILVVSDGSDDGTDAIVKELAQEFPNIQLFRLNRDGKPNAINYLVEISKGDIIISTDANVIFTKDTVCEVVAPFKDQKIGMVGSNLTSSMPHGEKGVSLQEKVYMERENELKYHEGILWGCMMGAFGGCYAMRKELFAEVPGHIKNDDFYLTMKVLLDGKDCILAPKAVCYEEASVKESVEFKRKIRLSSGNYQNLFRFFNVFWKCKPTVGFSFFSHKVLRWIGPFLLLIALVTSFQLRYYYWVYQAAFWGQLALMLFPLINKLLRAINLKSKLVQFVSYFYSMNLALLLGLFRYLSGGSSKNTWTPTVRQQSE